VSYLKSEKDFLLIGELADSTGVSRDTLRHYERKGVLPRPVRSPNGYRLYPSEFIERVKLIRRALAVGFTLDEIARIFAERERGNAPCREAYSLAVAKLEDVGKRISEMEMLRDDLENLVLGWNKKLGKISGNEPAYLLEDLAALSKNGLENREKSVGENLRRKNEKGK
jgi:DNA-binding transcriptional MerR regulator